MFEKKAENTGRELAILWVNFHYDPAVKLNRYSLEWAYRAGYKDGAEFGYDKAKEELQRLRDEIGRLQELLAVEVHKHKVTKDMLAKIEENRGE